MNFLRTSTGLTAYRVFLVSVCVVSMMIWIEAFEILVVILLACVPGMLNEQLKAQFGEQRAQFYVPGRFIAPYQLFVFVWNGFRSKMG